MGVRYRAKSSASASQTGGADTSGETPPWDDSPMDHIGGAGKESLPWNASHMGGVGVRPRASHTGGVGEDHCASRNGGYGSEPWRKRGRRTGGADATISPIKRYMEENKPLLLQKKEQNVADATRKLCELRAQGDGSPVTREELAKWVSDNIDQMRTRMREAPARRVLMNRRLWPRDDMCEPAPRLQPLSRPASISTTWGKLLEGRTGWCTLDVTHHPTPSPPQRPRTGPVFCWLQNHRKSSYIVDMHPFKDRGGWFDLSKTFNIRKHLRPLADLEPMYTDIQVRCVYLCKLECKPATGGGVRIMPSQGIKLSAPLKLKTKKIDVDDEGSDSEEVGGGDGSVDGSASTAVRRRGRVHDEDQIDGHSDLESSSGCVIDTGSEFETSGGESSEENEDPTTEIPEHYAAGLVKPAAAPATGGARPATGGKTRSDNLHLYHNPFFTFVYRHDYPGVVCTAVPMWRQDPPKGMGHTYAFSKSIQPHALDENLTNPTRTLFVLRAWMLWRAHRHHWSSGSRSRQRIFAAEAAHLEKRHSKNPATGG